MSIEQLDFEWEYAGAIPPDELVPARTALHNAAQYVAATGKALVPERADGSHTSMEWSNRLQALLGERIGDPEREDGFRVALRLPDVTLLVLESGDVTEVLPLEGRTLADGLAWLQAQVDRLGGAKKKLALPTHYEILSPMKKEETFVIESREACVELARYFANADRVFQALGDALPEASSIRCWPHHFDIGGLLVLEPSKPSEEARSVGFGLSPGDHDYSEPYFYINPYPSPDISKERLPGLEGSGIWHTEGWLGAVLPASRFSTLESGDEQKEIVKTHFLSGFGTALKILRVE